MKPRRRTGLAAVFPSAVSAGTIASSSGNATVTPKPRRNVRRGKVILLMNMSAPQVRSGRSTRGRRRRSGRLLVMCWLGLAHLKRRAFRHSENQCPETVTVRRGVAHDFANGRGVVVLEPPSQGVNHESFGESRHELIRLFQNPRPQPRWSIELRSVSQHRRRIDGGVAFAGSPLPGRIEVLERKAEWIHARVATCADRTRAMLLHPFPQGQHAPAVFVFL